MPTTAFSPQLPFLLLPLTFLLASGSGSTQFVLLNVQQLLASAHHARLGKNLSLSLPLHHVDSLSTKTTALRHRVSAMLLRDELRAAALLRRLSLSSADFSSDVISGVAQGSGEYFVRVGVGSPPSQQFLVLDSGSDLSWVQCQPCSQCYQQPDPLFDPARSASFRPVGCTSPACSILSASSCAAGSCSYRVTYGDGSYTRGTLVFETLTFDGAAVVDGVAIGCGYRNRGLFAGADGLLGLGWGPMSLVGQLGGAAGGAFGYCLPGRGEAGGTLVLGRTEAVRPGSVWVPLVRNGRAPSFYFVGVAAMTVGGVRLDSSGADGTVVDTGTAVTRLPGEMYAALREGFVEAAAGLPRAPRVSIFDTCFALGGYGEVRVPTVGFYFEGGAELTLPARNFLIPVDDVGTFCFAFAESGSEMAILGNIQQEGIQITVDAANGFLGFGPDTC
ncbi:hypothetical protein HPP92_002204 [Vanilla planifolia]|uniref:Peptidase A1 domain-containing protein n=1 Tax=Vanilla planifolia TaxID=51239 RepID=A0A835VKD5_VANPL|nr:hypothetical protein HPP92_002204 [Vanilla planifolia]